jgi:cardiolipin synthase
VGGAVLARRLHEAAGAMIMSTTCRRLGGWLAAVSALALATGCLSWTKRDVYTFDHPFTPADPAFRRSLDTFGTAMVAGNQATLLENGDAFVPAMVAAIQGAKVTVNLESYIFKDDRAGEIFADALVAAARRGVEVRMLLDGTGSNPGKLRATLLAAGVKLLTYHPVRLLTIYKITQRTHRKILVVDGKICFTGGMGIQKEWLGNAGNANEWRDDQVEVTGPVVAQMQAIFSEDWTYTGGEILAGEKFYPALAPTGEQEAQAIKIARGDSSSLAAMLYFVAIQSAERSIHIQNAYFLPEPQVRQALVAAVRRGVDVRVMVPGKHIDIPLVRMASRRYYGELLQGGVKIYEYAGTMMHVKAAVVDGIFATVGTINFDARSMRDNAEESMAFYDHTFAAQLEASFVNDIKSCHELTYARWRKRGIEQRIAERLSGFFQPLY